MYDAGTVYATNTLYYVILAIIVLLLAGACIYIRNKGLWKIWIATFIEWYIHENYSASFVHVDLIQPHMEKRLADMERILNAKRDKDEADKLEAQKLTFKIQESSWVAEITRLEKIVKDVSETKSKLIKLYFEVKARAKELSIITSQNQTTGQEIITNVNTSLGQLERIDLDIGNIVKEIMDKEGKELEILQIK
jgi:hypothetical protein